MDPLAHFPIRFEENNSFELPEGWYVAHYHNGTYRYERMPQQMPRQPQSDVTQLAGLGELPAGIAVANAPPVRETPPAPNGPPARLVEPTRRFRELMLEPATPINGEFTPDPTLVRQGSLSLELPPAVGIVGCGGVGSWLAYFLALAGVRKLLLFDSDRVSESNLNRAPYGTTLTGGITSVNVPKTEALKSFLNERRANMTFECHPNLTPAFADALGLTVELCPWLAISTDTLASRQDIHRWCRDHYVRYIEASAEGDFGSIAACPAEFATEAETQPGYASVPVWVGPCVAAASMACSHILHAQLGPDDSARFGWANGRIEFSGHYEEPLTLDPAEVALHGERNARRRAIQRRSTATAANTIAIRGRGVAPTITRNAPDEEEVAG